MNSYIEPSQKAKTEPSLYLFYFPLQILNKLSILTQTLPQLRRYWRGRLIVEKNKNISTFYYLHVFPTLLFAFSDSSLVTDLFLWFYQNLREFNKILGIPVIFGKIAKVKNIFFYANFLKNNTYIYFSDLTSRHFSQLQFQLPNLSDHKLKFKFQPFSDDLYIYYIFQRQCCISYGKQNFFSSKFFHFIPQHFNRVQISPGFEILKTEEEIYANIERKF
ncbi:hypothetical protein BpHYR1_044242 [Brachionus plicatilis]|uniref:Uncharacterized protein n=1 Tax=Brachionus plicatilis TaxID=10195 RepID=A0A3M7PIY4_BRAPC|nr:hypothetical protein BpHYR1_044242 [Brachionus plicatilis]